MARIVAALLALVIAVPALAEDAVTLVDAGTGDRRVLTLGVGDGAKQRASMVLDSASSTELLGQKIAIDAPPITGGLELTPTPAAAGAYQLAFAWKDVTVGQGDELGTMAAKKAAANMSGVRGAMTVAADGRVLEQHTEGGDAADFDLELWIPRLPSQPVGVGATWTWTSTDTDEQGFSWSEKTTYKLINLEATRATLEIATQRRSGTGSLKIEGMSVAVQGIVETGTGTAVVRLGQPFPEAGAWHLDVVTNATMLGKAATLTSRIDARLGGGAP